MGIPFEDETSLASLGGRRRGGPRERLDAMGEAGKVRRAPWFAAAP
jgi:hypothetical protein